ncbi:sensor histidine kinase [Methylobrevis pamukkalensis]|uniref:histidine kinase n=1 Tax=Methylobrevis pamukkalensis TaxID=1439726 RepID=A0A1E3H7H2_9HYPH|nr:histidine kinase dimerization/phosphoacceptor domain -containing protein [Methylobrevis pamukkalensis]ODN72254.1 putative sensor histidine kinase pdtaS [Methylobrevis pamukkalensis]
MTTRAPRLGMLVAVGSVVAAALCRYLADSLLPPGFPFLTFFPAVILTAFFYGLWPGIVAALLSTAAAWQFFMPHGPEATRGTVVALVFFASVTAVDLAIIHFMQVAQDRLRRERALSARLAEENRTLLHEAQHRISNNLQMLSSLLSLQKSGVRDEAARQAIGEAASRVKLIGKIQRDLYGRAEGEAAALIEELARDTLAAAGASHVTLTADLGNLPLSPDVVTPIGLVVLELVSNSVEHGGSGRPLAITVTLRRDGTDAVLTVVDDGIGLAPGFDPAAGRSLGLRLVQALTQQIGGVIAFSSGDGGIGTRVDLRFPAAA